MTVADHAITVLDRRSDAEGYRHRHPTLHVGKPSWEPTARGGRWSWTVTLESGPIFTSTMELDVSDAESTAEPTPSLGQALALVDALSYWKAAVPGRVIVDGTLPGTQTWWHEFVGSSMAEHLWRNGLDLSWVPTIEAGFADGPLDAPDHEMLPRATLALHSGGKDSITAAHLAHRAGRTVRPVSYQPTAAMRSVVEASAPPGGWAGPPVVILRHMDPQLLALNADGYLNGHTPYSAWLALAATTAADLCRIDHVAAGNSRSDDEPNITADDAGKPWPVNHQWTKSAEFEAAWAAVSGPHRRYASPLRPLFESAVLAGLASRPLRGADRALSCNRAAKAGHDGTWCGHCPKCLWTASALDALAGPGAGTARLGVDALADPGNTRLLAAMTGRAGPVPFECSGTPAEMRAVMRELRSRPGVPVALAQLDAHVVEARDGDDADLAVLVADVGPAPLLDAHEMDAAHAWAGSDLTA